MTRLFAGIAALTLGATAALGEPHRYELDPEHTTIAFLVDHLGYADTLGLFLTFEGGFTYDMDTQDLSDVIITVQTASVESFNEARDGHVRSGDFLNVETFPVMTFTATGGTPTSATTGTVEGELNLLGQTHPLTLDVTLNKAAKYPFGHGRFTLGLSARGTVTRSAYGMTYAVDNGFVGDEVQLILETEAMRIDE
ncbi:MAG: YceI family protein [Roseibium sp.]|uniref:YceI family protein n=1 Tax=Roseibium sp. TaxID=1936156 RepID=UPI00260650D9|nr:YceI family protein [Roseibium sp.]MCV0424075.1 YceI family protein [Roseibium sp.]